MLLRRGLADRTRALAATAWLIGAGFAACGCATSTAETLPGPPAPTVSLRGLRVRVRGEASPFDRELAAALETELARSGVVVLTDDRQPSDAQLRLGVDVRSAGLVVEGIGSLSVERNGTLVDRLSTSIDVYRRDRFPAAVAHELAELLAKSPRVEAFARAGRGEAPPPTPVAEAIPPPPAFIPPPPAFTPSPPPFTPPPSAPATPPPAPATPPPAPATPPPAPPPAAPPPAAPSAFSRSGAFGVGISLEVDLGWAQVFGPGASPSGAVVALALQADVTHRAAFRMPASFAVAGSGDDSFGHLALSPALLYRFLDDTDQRWVPYVGLGLRLGVMVAGRHLLGRPVTGVPTADTCSRRNQSATSTPIEDCAFTISPEPMVGIEWHTSRLFSLDFAATYSFSHVTSSEGLVSWVHLVQFYVGPRFSF